MATEVRVAAGGALGTTESCGRRSSTGGSERSETGRRWWPVAICLALYLACTVVLFGWSDPLVAGRVVGPLGELPDQTQQIWFIGWAEYALAHLQNPFFSSWQGYPIGFNVVDVPSILALGVVFSPITALFGPVVTWNVLTHLAFVLSAFSMCLVLRRCTKWWPAAFVGGLLYGFSSCATSDYSHLFVYFVPLPPLIFLLLYEILVRQRWRPARTGALLGVLCGAQYLISSEILVTTILMGATATVLYLVAWRRELASKWPYMKTSLMFSSLVGGLLLAYPVLFTLFGPEHLRGSPQAPISVAPLHSDLLSPFVPGFAERIGPSAVNVTISDPNFYLGTAMYLGIPLVVALVSIVVWLRRRRIVLLLGAMTVIAFIMSMGLRLYVDGHNTHIYLPSVVLEHLPFVDGLVPARFALYAALFASVILAIGLDEFHRRLTQTGWPDWLPKRVHRVAAVLVPIALAAIVAIPQLPSGVVPTVSTPVSPFFTSSSVASIPAGSVVLAYPYPQEWHPLSGSYEVDDALLDQAVSRLRFKVVGGYSWWPLRNSDYASPTPPPLQPLSVQTLFDACFFGTATPAQAALLTSKDMTDDLRSFMRRHQIGTVVALPIGRYPSIVTDALTAAIGSPSHFNGATVWLHVPHRLETTSPKRSPQLRALLETPPVTRVVKPAGNAELNGVQPVAALASSKLGVRTVVFRITGEGRTLIERADPYLYGWFAEWNTRSVPNGTYSVRSVVYGVTGAVATSTGVVFHVKN